MPIVRMPDGALVQMPDKLTPEQAIKLKAFQTSYAQKQDTGNLPIADQMKYNQEQYRAASGGLGDGLQEMGRLAMSGASHAIVAPVVRGAAGLAAGFQDLQGQEAARNAAENKWVYSTPEGSGARKVTEGLSGMTGRVMAPVGAALGGIDESIGKYAGPTAQNVVRKTFGVANDVAGLIPGVGVAAKGIQMGVDAARAARVAHLSHASVARTPIEVARAAGIRISPSSVHDATAAGESPSMLARAAEDVAGPVRAHGDNIRHNKPPINDIGAQDIGLKSGTLLTDDALDRAEKPAIEAYKRIAKAVPSGPLSPKTQDLISKAGFDDLVPGQKIAADAVATKGALLTGEPIDSEMLKDTISRLRQQGYQRITPDVPGGKVDPDMKLHGSIQLDIANALEEEMLARANKVSAQLGIDFQNGRTLFAKAGTIRRARTGFDIDPHKIKTAGAKSNAISGGLKIIDDIATHFPNDVNIKVPTYQETASSRTLGVATMGMWPAIRKGLQTSLNVTRGERATPNLGPNGPLGYYYKGNEYQFPAKPSKQPALIPGQDYTPHPPPRGPSRPHGAEGPLQQDASIPMPLYGSGMDKGPGRPYNYTGPASGNNALSAADERMAAALSHPGTARITPKQLMLPAPGKSSHRGVTEALSNQARLQHKARPNNPLSSTVTEAEKKAQRDHIIQVLAARKRAGTLREQQ